MARLTPEEILKLSEPVEQVYSNVVDALLVNLAKHFNTGKSLSAEEWMFQKLAELGQLNRESIEIIARLTGQAPAMLEIALEQAALEATKDIEPELKQAVKKGALQPPQAGEVLASKSITQALSALDRQAVEKLNLVNTTMLESTLNLFRRVVSNTAAIEQQMTAAQQALNTAAGKVVTGVESRTQALRKALEQIHKEGITGFYDRAGRKWSPEAYVNMDVRTTLHNTAIEAVKLRQEDYGTDIFRVSRHAGARPLCYPYQGKYYTWGNEGGTFTDGAGTRHSYRPVSSTSYGKPAGLFGINCGHHPIPMVPGVTVPVEYPPPDKEENDRLYQLSQEQRRLEREVRYAKQKAAMLDAAGDREGFEKEALKIRNAQAKYNQFCKETGRTKRLDRTQVYEYNRSVSSKATAAAKRAEEARKREEEKYLQINYHPDGTIVVTDDWTGKKNPHLNAEYKPNAVVDTVSRGGKQRDRMIYDENGRQKTQISNGPHANPKRHKFGSHGEHAHDIVWENGEIVSRNVRELTDQERKENADIL